MSSQLNPTRYAVSQIPTPIYNTPDIPFNYVPLKKDTQGRLVEVETIAFPGTKFKYLEQVSDNIVRIETSEYPSAVPLYVDSRFLKEAPSETPERQRDLPSCDSILAWIESRKGLRYFWGGNWETGIPQMLEFYPFLRDAPIQDRDDVICRGLDCSGLLHQATNGITPRNTSDLVNFDHDLNLQHLPVEQIQDKIKPLDLLVWRGHVIIVQSPTTLIESRVKVGVVITNFADRFLEVVETLKEQNKPFYFRRWHPDNLHPK
jgi:cell wall-associated NlpC family hydrolase